MKTLLVVILTGIMSSILFCLFKSDELSRKDVREILEDDSLIFQKPLGVGA